ncbi:ShlB/FhaC/HecB family hemolysin secretion/activation protein [Sphaerospermopsis sp. LEGE 00249]|uniref:ShlB/FhaC/HecB family hemolysin secretion/activation protein n=1 Tax=Sphaerospermopsis sp. LEGE 00249 TaxID=1380707 RepID=UPI00164E9708|nr:ShlB/FhaC/HecB family hemolysin secretion/activation protein [Sphaerospermopsis sp. LEGE 00249]MBC5796874.1 ShlB/FhaC/HecB family hemolysin secretion/activation protein [Sphaerospermopsis sp. LEGE 00249]
MRWYLQGRNLCVFFIPSTLLLFSASPGHARSSSSFVLLKQPDHLLTQVTNKPNQQSNQQLESNQEVVKNTDVVSSSVFLEISKNRLAQGGNPADNTNEKRFIQPVPDAEPLTPENQPIVPSETETQTETETETETEKIQVNKIEVLGSTIFNQEQLNTLTKEVEGRSVSLEELTKVADAITQFYLDRGYLTSRAILANSTITDGVVKIQIIEGGLEKIEVEGTKHIHPNYVRSRVALGIKKPLSTADIENQLRLLRIDPLFSKVEGILRAGTKLGESILVVRVTEANPLQASLNVDNYSPPSVGSERFGINTVYRNLTGWGDELAASYYFTARGGSNVYDFSYRIPVNTMNGTVQLRTAINNNQVIQEPFKNANIRGESQLYEISFRQPLVRSLRQEFALSLGFTVQDGQTFTFAGPTAFGFGPDENANSRTRVIKFGQDYLSRDLQGAWSLRSLFSLGIDVFDATRNADPIPDGQFFSWLGQIQRIQRISDNYLLFAQAEVQLTPNSLLPSQQFIIGGGQSVRGYRQNTRAGDNGVRFAVENQITLSKDEKGNSSIKIAPFFDLGYVWNKDDNPNTLQRQTFLAGTGVGVLWQLVPGFNIRLDYSLPLINLDDRGVNAQDDGFYFSVGYKL